MSKATSKYGASTRRNIVLLILAAICLAFIARLVYLQVYTGKFLVAQAQNRSLRIQKEDALRGMILDREGEPLAISSPVSSIVVDPKVFWATLEGDFERQRVSCLNESSSNPTGGVSPYCQWINDEELDKQVGLMRYQTERMKPMAEMLNMSVDELYTILDKRATRRFYYLKRQLPPGIADEILALGIKGVSRENSYQRFYPTGEIMGQIIGFTNVDEQGIEGVELVFNDWLAGQPGRIRYLQGETQNAIRVEEEEVPAAPGAPLQLSIDKRIQYITHQVMLETKNKFNANSVSAVMVDVKSGEILAMVSLPAGNPNNSSERIPKLMRNRIITDVFEPGSTIKPIVMAAALEAGVVTENTSFKTQGIYRVGHNLVKDTHNYGTLDSVGVIRKSSNIGMAMISERLPRQDYYNFLKNMGFGEVSGIEFPGEREGVLRNPEKLGDFSYATTTFGYGISATALQIAHAYATIANDGVKMPLTLLKKNDRESGQRVMSHQTAASLNKMLQAAVGAGGTGSRSQADSYTVAGKTGTSHKIINGQYADNRYRGVFAGYAPVNDPRIAVVIVVDDPQSEGGEYYGGLVAAPSFAKISEWSLKMLGVLPDKIAKSDSVNLVVDEELFNDNDLEALPDAPI